MNSKGAGIDVLNLAPEAAGKFKEQGIDTVEMFLAQAARPGGVEDICSLLGVGPEVLGSMVEEAKKHVDPGFLELLDRPVKTYPMGALFENEDPEDEGPVTEDAP